MGLCVFAILSFSSVLVGAPPPKNTPPLQHVASTKKEAFNPFTGKVSANKVRMRVKPDLESHVLKQVNKDELLLVVGEEGEFYAVEPPKETKAYVFRSYVLDDRIEASKVNVRLEPHADAPIIGQLQAGTHIKGRVSPINQKWLEIPAPKGTCFYISKEYVSQAGGPEFITTMQQRKTRAEELLNSAFLIAETECKKTFEEMSPQFAIEKFQTIIHDFSDFPSTVTTAKEALALLKETYLNKKISYLESKAELSTDQKEELLAKHRQESKELFADAPVILDPNLWSKHSKKISGAPKFWDALEESLYLSWTAFHTGKKMDDFYAEQKANASILKGTIEPYAEAVKDRPGDFLFRTEDDSVAYLYSTQVDLSKHLGKQVSLSVSPRPNNHFAFPAYFVLSVD